MNGLPDKLCGNASQLESPMDRFDSMRVFAKVVESGGFAGAAVRLGISPSMVSQHVKNLEERLHVRLLNRTTRKVNLTETGRAYYERCTRLLADLEEAERAASDMHAAPRGDLRVNASPHFGMLYLASAIADFTVRFPAISAELILTERIVDLIEEGFDVAVRVEQPPASSLIARQLAPCRMVICGTPGYFEMHGVPRTPADLTAHNCLTFAGTWLSHYRAWQFTMGRRCGAEPLADWKSTDEQRRGAQSRCAHRSRLGLSADLPRRRCAAVGAPGAGAERLPLAATDIARPLPTQPSSIG
jgi:DNA-binding transcriptional LysR family regulator